MRFTGNIRWLRTRRGGECLKIMNKTLDKKLVKYRGKSVEKIAKGILANKCKSQEYANC